MKKTITTLSVILFVAISLQAQVITTIAGNGTSGYTGNGGPAVNALLDHPNQLAFDQAGNLYIAEDFNNVVRKIDVSGNISLVAGTGAAGFSGDGFPATNAQLNRAAGVAVDATGNVYICDADNYRIRKVSPSGIITTIAGTGTQGYSGDGFAATAADIGFNSGICLDAAGNIYFASQTPGHCVRKINTSGIISTVAGTGVSGYNGDGISAITAQLTTPAAVFVDAAGNLFIGDVGGMRVRKVTTSGTISTVAGNGNAASGGDGGLATSAQLFYPYGVITDAAGNLYICESGNNRIRKVNAAGQISTFAGVPSLLGGYGGDNGSALLAQFYHPSAVALDATGNVFIGDYENSAIRKIVPGTAGIDNKSVTNESLIDIYPNPSNDFVNIVNNASLSNYTLRLFNLTGQLVFENRNIKGNINTIDVSKYPNGIYFLETSTNQLTSRTKLVKY